MTCARVGDGSGQPTHETLKIHVRYLIPSSFRRDVNDTRLRVLDSSGFSRDCGRY
ncbi:hypothetical protein WG66_011316 [Moniliophthora roreri]|nr:hypothetical protein WG66_011316 [Moniliophthora roreri]